MRQEAKDPVCWFPGLCGEYGVFVFRKSVCGFEFRYIVSKGNKNGAVGANCLIMLHVVMSYRGAGERIRQAVV